MTVVTEPNRSIILIGFASSGKTTTALALAQNTRLLHIDLDSALEERYKNSTNETLSCREIYRKLGPELFSALETETLKTLQSKSNIILSTGGGAPLNSENSVIIKAMGKIVYLRADLKTTLKRMETKGIPLSLSGSDMEQQWNRRDIIYSSLADFIVDNSTHSPQETATYIIDHYFKNIH